MKDLLVQNDDNIVSFVTALIFLATILFGVVLGVYLVLRIFLVLIGLLLGFKI